MISRFVRTSWLLAAFALTACGKDSSGPAPVATTVALAPSSVQTAVAGSVVTPTLTFSVKDQNGKTMSGVPVTITVTGGGTITGAPTTTTGGETPVGTWTLGNLVGVNTLSVKVGDLAPVTFSITTVAGPPALIISVAGGGQFANAGTPVSGISVKVVDKFGNGVSAQPVTVTVTEGAGTVNPASGTTDASGVFCCVTWTLGKLALPQTLTFSSVGVSGTVPANVLSNYPLDIVYYGTEPTPQVKAIFDSAVARIRGIVIGPLQQYNIGNLPLNSGDTNCGVPIVTSPGETTRGMRIYASVRSIDGAGNVLGSAGPCIIRESNRLTAIGIANFDQVDLANPSFAPLIVGVITHELLHALGIGTLWCAELNDGTCGDWTTAMGFDTRIPSLLTGFGTDNPRYTGTGGVNGCLASNGTSACFGGVAVENCIGISGCGNGTRDSHWREKTFNQELMTGYAQPNMALSVITIGALADLGYQVNAVVADPYSVPPPGLQAIVQSGSQIQFREGPPLKPKATISPSGRVRPIKE